MLQQFTAVEENSANGKSTHATQSLTIRPTSSQEYKQSRLTHSGCQLCKETPSDNKNCGCAATHCLVQRHLHAILALDGNLGCRASSRNKVAGVRVKARCVGCGRCGPWQRYGGRRLRCMRCMRGLRDSVCHGVGR
jgi:hypothetical protein